MSKRGYTLVEVLVVLIIISVFAAIITSGFFVCSAAKSVSNNGIKGTVERLWEGPAKEE